MSNNIYDLLNDNNINMEELSTEGFNDIEKKQIKKGLKKSINKNKNKKKRIVGIAIAGAITIVVLGSSFGTSVAAIVKLASIDIAYFLGINKNIDGYKTVVGETKSSDGVSIRLNEVVLNGNELMVSTTTKYEKGDSEIKSIHSFGEVFINGRNASDGGSGGGRFKDSAMQEVMTYILKENQLKGDLDIKIVYSSININRKTVKIKPCVFEFTTNGDELAKGTVEIPLNHSFKLQNGSIVTLNKYVGNVIDKKIFLSIQNSNAAHNIQLKGYDNAGNRIEFTPSFISNKEGMLKLSTVEPLKINDKATEITLTPYSDYQQLGEKFTIKIK